MDSFAMKLVWTLAGLLLPTVALVAIEYGAELLGLEVSDLALVFFVVVIGVVASMAFAKWRRTARATRGGLLNPERNVRFEGSEAYFQIAVLCGFGISFNTAFPQLLRGAV